MIRSNCTVKKVMRSVVVTLVAGLSLSLVGCGKSAFNVTMNTQQASSPGYFNVPPKVDVLLFVDDTGSMITSFYSTIQTQVPTFLNQLRAQNWDYHFALNPLTARRTQIPQVVGSVYDASSPGWIAPYPGAVASSLTNIVPRFFRTPDSSTDFLSSNDVNNSLNGREPGFENIWYTLNHSINGTGFLRPDAMLVVMVIGNGNDDSDVVYSPRPDGLQLPTASSLTSSFNTYQSRFAGFCGSGAKCAGLQFHAAVNAAGSSTCLNGDGSSIAGDRYLRMARSLNSATYGTTYGAYDICSQSINSVLTQLNTNLSATKIPYQTDFLILDQEPNPSTIKVTKYPAGDTSSPQSISQGAAQGWIYVGRVTGQNVSSVSGTSVRMNPATGYAIKLNGSAVLSGNDTASVDFKPAGVTDSVSQ